MRVRAFAKINLSLRVLGVRADGHHELRTTFQSIALHDTLTIRASRGPLHLTCDDPGCPADDTNLVWRAAARLWTAAGRRGAPRDIAMHLQKRIPMQAGLGGGSSDAAAALAALGTRWKVDAVRVRAIASALGADVPYFFEGGTVLGLERGDRLLPLADEPVAWVVLVIPAFGVSTKDAFGWFDDDVSANPVAETSRGRPAERHTGRDTNDLERSVSGRHPEIGRIISALGRAGATQAAMSGSGSAVFGLFRSRAAARRAARGLQRRTRRVLVTRTLTRARYRALART